MSNKYIKLFEEFNSKVYEHYNNIQSTEMGPISRKRSEGSVNWFTKDEIQAIREGAKSIGISFVGESNNEDAENFFGNENGLGLSDSWKEFIKGGNLCGEVHLSNNNGKYTIMKKNSRFSINGKVVGSNVADAISYIL
jgi:hypothetical protein